MKKQQNGLLANAEKEAQKRDVPTVDVVTQWVRQDLTAAHYFLGILLRYPEIMESVGKQIYEHAMSKENGAAVDHLKKES